MKRRDFIKALALTASFPTLAHSSGVVLPPDEPLEDGLRIITLQYPEFLNQLPDAAQWKEKFRTLVEDDPISISGLGVTSDLYNIPSVPSIDFTYAPESLTLKNQNRRLFIERWTSHLMDYQGVPSSSTLLGVDVQDGVVHRAFLMDGLFPVATEQHGDSADPSLTISYTANISVPADASAFAKKLLAQINS